MAMPPISQPSILVRISAYVSAALLGVLAGFFLVFNAVFSDVFGLGQRLLALAVIVVGYFVISSVLSLAWPKLITALIVVLMTPAVVIVMLYSLREPNLIWHGLCLVAAATGALAGRSSGAILRRGKTPSE
jgi:Na+/proline symporter